MKKLFTSILLLGALSLAHLASATDRTVGAGGTYATIMDAVAAAADGDRILVKPRAVPYNENFTITKSLTILSADEGTYFNCVGPWKFNPVVAGKSLTVIGMRSFGGDFGTDVNAPAGTRCKVSLLGSVLRGGGIGFDAYQYDVLVSADSIQGNVILRFGRLIGNYIDGSTGTNVIQTYSDNTATSDSLWIVGNKVRGNSSNNWNLYLNNTTQYLYCANNLFLLNANGTANADYGILNSSNKTGSGQNTIANNTFQDMGSGNYCCGRYAIQLNSPSTNTQIIANVIVGTNNASGSVAILQSGGANNYTVAYNYLRGYGMSVSVPSNGTNVVNSNTTLNAANGRLIAGSDAINGGPTDAEYTDLDLTRGDAGAYGGSFSLDNFHPFVGAMPAANAGGRVFLIQAPRHVLQGGSINVKATGFDR